MKYLLLLFSLVSLVVWCSCNPCTEVQSVNITNGTVHSNGSVVHNGVEFGQGKWYEVVENGTNVIYGCPCIDHICIYKCCGESQAFQQRVCVDTEAEVVNPFNPTVYKGKEPTNVTASEHFYYLHRTPCNDYYGVDEASPGEELYIQENGTLMEVSLGGVQWHAYNRYCVDMSVFNSSVTPSMLAAVCYPDSVDTNDDSPALYTAYAIGLLLSVPFLLATFLVYAIIPELRNLHGMCLMAYCAGLIIGYPFLSFLKLHVGRMGGDMTACIGIAFIVYYSFQTSFFWLNIMCFDIWRTFSGYRGGSMNKRRETRRFIMYGIYAWGVPALLTIFTMVMQLSPNIPDYLITPGFGMKKCWFVDFKSELLYFYPSVLILVVVNVILFTVTAFRIRSIRQETAILKGSESSRSDKLKKDKQRYSLYLKLFVVMGVNWTVEVIGFAVGGSNYYWILIDISNIALGIFIFFIFVWKKKVRNLVRKRFQQIRGVPVSSEGTGTKWTSSAPTEDTRVSADETAIRLKEMR